MVSFRRQRGLIPRRARILNPRETLVDVTAGTFTRSSVATYRTSATTVASAAIDVQRFQNLGDGNGAVAYFEGARTGLNPYSHSLGSWVQNPANNIGQSNIGTAPDGTATAGRVYKTGAGSFGPGVAINGGTTPGWCLSMWVKDNAATAGNSERMRFSYAQGMAIRFTIPSGWTYLTTVEPTTMAIPNDFINFDHRVNIPKSTAPADPVINTTSDILVWGIQLEVGCLFASSTIITTGLAATRAADVRTLTTAQYRSRVGLDPSQGYFIPTRGSSQMADGDEFWLFSFGGANSGMRVRKSGGLVKLECTDGGSVQVASSALTFSPYQKITHIQRPGSGFLDVSGATTGNGSVVGSSFVFDAATCRVGGILSGASEAFAAIGNLVSV